MDLPILLGTVLMMAGCSFVWWLWSVWTTKLRELRPPTAVPGDVVDDSALFNFLMSGASDN